MAALRWALAPAADRLSGGRERTVRAIQRHGRGRSTSYAGDQYDGEWFADQREGAGTLALVNGDRYEGNFYRNQVSATTRGTRAGDVMWDVRVLTPCPAVAAVAVRGRVRVRVQRHGQGTLTTHSGDVYVGLWELDLPHGKGTMTYVSGERYTGDWQIGQVRAAHRAPRVIGVAVLTVGFVRSATRGRGVPSATVLARTHTPTAASTSARGSTAGATAQAS